MDGEDAISVWGETVSYIEALGSLWAGLAVLAVLVMAVRWVAFRQARSKAKYQEESDAWSI